MDKKIFMILMCMILFIGFASAMEFDNVKDYDSSTKTVTVVNAFGLGEDIATIKLNTPLNVKVGLGYQRVAEFDIVYYMDDNGGMDLMEFYDKKKSNEKIEKEFDYKVKGTEEFEVDDFKRTLTGKTINGTDIYEQVKVGSHLEERVVWNDFNKKDMIKGETYTIGIFTTTKEGDYVEWIPTFYGVKIDEWATWTAGLNVNLVAYWKLDDSLVDEVNGYDGTSHSVGYGAGKINNAMVSGYWDANDQNDFDFPNAFSISAWYKGSANSDIIIAHQVLETGSPTEWYIDYAGGMVRFYKYGTGAVVTKTINLQDGDWHHIVVTRDDSDDWVLYIDNDSQDTANDGQDFTNGDKIESGARAGGQVANNPDVDELAVWKGRALSVTEVALLYQAPPYDANPITPPVVTLNSPVDYYNTTSPTITLNCTASDDENLVNVSLYIDGVLNQTNSSGLNNTAYIFPITISEGYYNWTCLATDNESESNTPVYRYFNYSDASPNVTLETPINYYNTSNDFIDFECLVTDDVGIANVSLIINDVINFTEISPANDSSMWHMVTDFEDGDYNWTCIVYDTIGQSFTATEQYFTIDTIAPILTPASNLTDLIAYSLPTNSTWSFNATDPHIDDCYYNTTDQATSIVTCNSTINTEWATAGDKTITFCANDTYGYETCNSTSIHIYFITTSTTDLPDPVGEGVNVQYDFYVSEVTSIPVTTANLIHNGTRYSVSTISSNGTQYHFQKNIIMQDGWGSPTGQNVSFYWEYNLTGVVTGVVTSTENTTVYSMDLDDCSVFGDVILNWTLDDEELANPVNATAGANVEINLLITSLDNSSLSWEYNNTWTDLSVGAVCVPSGLITADANYSIDFTIGFDSTDRVWEFYYLDDGVLDNTDNFDSQTTNNIYLMDLATTDSTSFLFNYFDRDGLPVDDTIIHVFRKYIGEGIFREVERAKSDQNGDTIIHLVEEDVIYYFMITQYGVPLYTSSIYSALCQATPCTIQISASSTNVVFDTDWDLLDNGAYEISSDKSTRVVNMTYKLNESATMNLTVYKYESDGSYLSIATGSDTGTSGTILLTVPQSAGNVTFFTTVYQDDGFINSQWVDFEQDAQDRFGITLSLFLSALIILTLGLMAVTEGIGTIIMVVLGVALAGFLGLMTTSLSTGVNIVIYLVLAGGLLIWKLSAGRK